MFASLAVIMPHWLILMLVGADAVEFAVLVAGEDVWVVAGQADWVLPEVNVVP
jgi:hypothetical protein